MYYQLGRRRRASTNWRALLASFVLLAFGLLGLCIGHSGNGESVARDGSYQQPKANQNSVGGFHQVADAVSSLIYEPSFPGLARTIIGRQDDTTATDLKNNAPGKSSISPGQTQYWRFPSSELHGPGSNESPLVPSARQTFDDKERVQGRSELKRQAREPWLHITLSVCSQPVPSSAEVDQPPPQPKLLISWKNPKPGTGPSADTSVAPVMEGFGRYDNQMSGDLFIAVEALSATGYSGSYTYELAGSIDTPYADYQDATFLHALDSDSGAGLFVTSSLTDPGDAEALGVWEGIGPRFSIFAHNINDTQFSGIRRSYCGLRNNAQIGGGLGALDSSQSSGVETGIETFGGGAAKQLFYVGSMNKSSTYHAILGLESNYSVPGSGHPGGGGTVWRYINMTTKTEENCRLIYNLTFCTNVNYAVPGNASVSHTQLAQLYDNNTRALYTNFSYSMQQIPCDAPSDARYSLAVTCDNCTAAYKQWLCAVTMPRCVDSSSQRPYLQARNVGQDIINGISTPGVTGDGSSAANVSVAALSQSRNLWIDTSFRPGPYKELLPCGSLCHSLVQSCPSALGFACPYNGKGFNQSYGYASMDGDYPTCNIPGAIWGISGAQRCQPTASMMVLVSILAVIWNLSN